MWMNLLLWTTAAVAGAPSTWTLTVENDSPWSLMWNQPYRDEYYTNGVRLSRTQWVDGHTDRGLGKGAQAISTALRLGRAESVRFGMAQTMYTPVEFWEPYPIPEDHPYAGHAHFTASMAAVRDGFRSSIALLGGWTGPGALTEPTQKWVHEVLNGAEPLGWRHQVRTEPTFGVTVGLSAVDLASASDGRIELRVVPTVLAVAATTDVAAEVGGIVGLGTEGEVPSVRPEEARFGHSAPDGHLRGASSIGFAVYAFFDARTTTHDMFVAGGTFSQIGAPEAESFVSEAGLGMHVRIVGTRLSMSTNHQSRTFEGQERPHVYGTICVAQDLGFAKNQGTGTEVGSDIRQGRH